VAVGVGAGVGVGLGVVVGAVVGTGVGIGWGAMLLLSSGSGITCAGATVASDSARTEEPRRRKRIITAAL
jgi:hypothetical protein